MTTARTGRIEYDADERFLLLDSGQRNDVSQTTGDKTLSRFGTYRVSAGDRVVDTANDRPPKARPTLELLQAPSALYQGELAWRLGLAIGGANLVLLGVGLAATNPRRASSWNLLFALLAFIVYYNIINLSQAWVASGKLSMGGAMLAAHGGAFALSLTLLWWRDHRNNRRPWNGFRRRDAAAAT